MAAIGEVSGWDRFFLGLYVRPILGTSPFGAPGGGHENAMTPLWSKVRRVPNRSWSWLNGMTTLVGMSGCDLFFLGLYIRLILRITPLLG